MGSYPANRPYSQEELDAYFHDLANVSDIVELAHELVAEHGFETLKIKSAGVSVEWDVAVMKALRDAFGPNVALRLDPNGAFNGTDALRLGLELEPLRLEYFEDPTNGI